MQGKDGFLALDFSYRGKERDNNAGTSNCTESHDEVQGKEDHHVHILTMVLALM